MSEDSFPEGEEEEEEEIGTAPLSPFPPQSICMVMYWSVSPSVCPVWAAGGWVGHRRREDSRSLYWPRVGKRPEYVRVGEGRRDLTNSNTSLFESAKNADEKRIVLIVGG